MQSTPWRDDLAALLTEVARCLSARRDRQAAKALGTALAYLERLCARGEPGAEELLRLLRATDDDGDTERFTFTPGELDAIKQRNGLK